MPTADHEPCGTADPDPDTDPKPEPHVHTDADTHAHEPALLGSGYAPIRR